MAVDTKKMLVTLADDDQDDQFFFKEAFEELKMLTELLLFPNGRELLVYLKDPDNLVPDILFLDLNKPTKGGIDALREIKSEKRLSGHLYNHLFHILCAKRHRRNFHSGRRHLHGQAHFMEST